MAFTFKIYSEIWETVEKIVTAAKLEDKLAENYNRITLDMLLLGLRDKLQEEQPDPDQEWTAEADGNQIPAGRETAT